MRKMFYVFLIALTFPVFVACAETSGNDSDPSDSVAEDDEVVTIEWVDYQSTEQTERAIHDIIAAYENENPHVKINRTFIPFADIKNQLLMGSAASNLPDIVWIDNPDHQSFAAAGILADITDKVEEWGEADHFFEGPLASAMYEGKYFGLPNTSNNLALFYNEDMLEEAGLAPPATWEELKAAADVLTKDGIYGLAVSAVKHEMGTFQFLPFLYQAGSEVTDFNSQGTIDAIQLWKDFYDSGVVSREILTMDQNDTMLQFEAGNVAMVVNGTWQVPGLEEEPPPFNWNVTALPSYKEAGTILGGENWAITAASEHIEIAWDIIKFAQQKEHAINYSKAAGRLPSRVDFIEDPYWQENEQLKVFADGMEVAKARAYGPDYPQISQAIQDMLHHVLTGGQEIEDAVEEASQKIEPLLP